MEIKFFKSISGKIVLLAIMIVVLGGIARYIIIKTVHRDQVSNLVTTQLEATNRLLIDHLSTKVNELTSFLTGLSSKISLTDTDTALDTLVRSDDRLLKTFSGGIYLQNNIEKNIEYFETGKKNPSTHCQGKKFLENSLSDRNIISAVEFSKNDQAYFCISVPIKGDSNPLNKRLVGLIFLNDQKIFNAVNYGQIGQQGGFLVIDRENNLIIASNQPKLILKSAAPPKMNPLHDIAMSGVSGSGTTINAQGVNELSAFAPIPNTPWFTVSRVPLDEALFVVYEFEKLMIKSVPISAIFIIMIIIFVINKITKPLKQTADHARKIACGEMEMQPLPVLNNDEVGEMTEAFNLMMKETLVSREKLHRLAHTDQLTGISNRLELYAKLKQVKHLSQRKKCRYAILFLDLDNFKDINDSLGHDIGDFTLVTVAKRLSDTIRKSDILARMGGDEFVIVLVELDQDIHVAKERAQSIANKCIEVIRQHIVFHDHQFQINASIGITIGDCDSDLESLISTSDKYMYEAKRGGRGKAVMAWEK